MMNNETHRLAPGLPDFLERVGGRFLFLEAGRLHPFDTLAALSAAPIAHAALN